MSEPDRYDLLGAAFAADPAPVLHRMRREHPVYRDPTLGTWVLTRFRDVERVVKDPAFSVDRGGSISRCDDPAVADELAWCSAFALRWMVFSDPPRQTRLRAAVHREFTSAMVERLRPVAAAATRAALAAVASSRRIELLADLAVPVPAVVTAALLGLPHEDVDKLKQWTADMFALFGAGVARAEVVRAAHVSMRAAHAYFAEEVARRAVSTEPQPDLLTALVRARHSELELDDLIGLCVTLVAGAYETTTHLVGNGVLALLRHPEELARLRREPALIEPAVEEIFRYDGPAVSVVRRARADVRIDDHVIAAGDNVYCMLYAANRDPEQYPDPDRFDLGRFDPGRAEHGGARMRHLGLGHGIHFCVGAALSRLEAAVMLGAVVHELDGLALDRDALPGGEPTFAPNLAIRGVTALPLRFEAYRPRA